MKSLYNLSVLILLFLFAKQVQAQTAISNKATISKPVGANTTSLSKWSDPNTWNNKVVPGVTDIVTIPAGAAVLLDQNVMVKNIIIMGMLVVEPTKNVAIETHSIELMGSTSYLEWGTEANPYQYTGSLTLKKSTALETTPMSGLEAKGILIMNGGKIEIHGKVKKSWTLLNATIAANTTTLALNDVVDWQIGDSIVVASSSHANENEKACIASISLDKKSITISAPLKYGHWGTTETFSNSARSWTLDERAEVGLLTRNILIQGDADSETDQKGVYIMVMDSSFAKVSGVEIYRTGLGAVLARYPFHWHGCADVTGQYIKNSTVHRSFNRAITIHGSQNALIEDNVCFDIVGHAIFLEDGIETGNTINNNLVMSVRKPLPGMELLASDIFSATAVDFRAAGPAGIWITHPDNTVTNNHVSGAGSGIWYALPSNPTGFSFTTAIQNRSIPIKKLDNNFTHTCVVGVTFDYSSKQDATGKIIGVEAAHYNPNVFTLIPRKLP
jgi:hypothetical protein